MGAKARYKVLRDNFRKELRKTYKPISGDGAPPQAPRSRHFSALQFLRDVMEPGQDVMQYCIYTDLQRGTARIAGRRNNKPGEKPGIRD